MRRSEIVESGWYEIVTDTKFTVAFLQSDGELDFLEPGLSEAEVQDADFEKLTATRDAYREGVARGARHVAEAVARYRDKTVGTSSSVSARAAVRHAFKAQAEIEYECQGGAV